MNRSAQEAAAEFDEFYAGTAARVLRQLVLMTSDQTEAEDVTEQAFERAWLHWADVRDCRCPEGWVRTVALRRSATRARLIRRIAPSWLHRRSPSALVAMEPSSAQLTAALGRLPRPERVALVLHDVARLPVDQVAHETGASASQVELRLCNGRTALTDWLGGDRSTSTGPDLMAGAGEVLSSEARR